MDADVTSANETAATVNALTMALIRVILRECPKGPERKAAVDAVVAARYHALSAMSAQGCGDEEG